MKYAHVKYKPKVVFNAKNANECYNSSLISISPRLIELQSQKEDGKFIYLEILTRFFINDLNHLESL